MVFGLAFGGAIRLFDYRFYEKVRHVFVPIDLCHIDSTISLQFRERNKKILILIVDVKNE